MTDSVTVAIITGVCTMGASALSAWFARKSLKKSEQNASKLATIEEQGNGHTDKLVAMQKVISEAKGAKDEKARTQRLKPAKSTRGQKSLK